MANTNSAQSSRLQEFQNSYSAWIKANPNATTAESEKQFQFIYSQYFPGANIAGSSVAPVDQPGYDMKKEQPWLSSTTPEPTTSTALPVETVPTLKPGEKPSVNLNIPPIPTPPTTPSKSKTANTGSTGSSSTSTSTSGYKTVNGVLLHDGVPLNGYNPSDQKYYNQGKLETDAQVKSDFLSKYKEQATFIASIPELGGSGINGQPSLLDQAIKGNWSIDQWTAAFQNSDWIKAHPGNIGLAEIQRQSTPSLYNDRYNAVQSRLAKLAASTGLTFTPGQLGQQIDPNGAAPTVDQTAIQNGQDLVNWVLQQSDPTDRRGDAVSDAEIIQRMAQYGKLDPSNPNGGQVFRNVQSLQQIANNYGTNGLYTQDQLNNYGQQILQGTYDPSTFEAQQKMTAMQMYKPFAAEIANGSKVSDLASPYMSTLAGLLEVDPSDITLGSNTGYGKMIADAMRGDGTTAVDPLTFANTVRSQPQWLNTKNAQSTLLGAGDYIINKMGLG
jgi:hypothetical protein